jgi:thiosulfate dehydrogenase
MKNQVFFFLFSVLFIIACNDASQQTEVKKNEESVWIGWNHSFIKREDSLTQYGYQLITNTAFYLGPKGKVIHSSNGMNCQNCHLQAGTIPWGNNYSAVASTYPKFRNRSSTVETISKRVNDCIERSLNGNPIDTNSKEMNAIIAYLKWIGAEVPIGKKPKGSGIEDISFLNRAADKTKGEKVYQTNCARCHGENGEGQMNSELWGYTYPPLWGNHSFNIGAGLFRLSRMAGFIKNNMPYQEATYKSPKLTDEEAWDVAAYIVSQPRPTKNLSKDWSNISTKPFDYPFAPYKDSFNELQHKFGPFQSIVDYNKKFAKK